MSHVLQPERTMAASTDLSPWNQLGDSTQNLFFSFETRSSESKLGSVVCPGKDMHEHEDRGFLGSLLCAQVSPSSKRKRSLSSVLESEEFGDTPTSSDSSSHTDRSPGTQTRVTASRKKLKALACNFTIHKDMLSLSLPNSTRSESSSSSHGSYHELQSKQCLYGLETSVCKHDTSDATDHIPWEQSTCVVQPTMEGTSFGILHQTLRIERGNQTDGVRSLNSFTDAAHLNLTLSNRGLEPDATFQSYDQASSPVEGLAASRFKEEALLKLHVDNGLEAHGLQLIHLLLKCADAMANDNIELAAGILGELYQGASLYGDSMQRVAAYFAEGLAARIVSKNSPLYSSLMVEPSTEDYFSAFTALYKVAPYFQFAHFTSNQAILEAVKDQSAVHVVDLNIMQGFQWPSLIQAFASRPGGPPHLRITGVGRRGDTLQETGKRLASFAQSFAVPFEYQSVVVDRLESLTLTALAPRAGEISAISSILQLHRLLNPACGDGLEKFLVRLCEGLNPCVVTVVEQEANHNCTSFLGRFVEALHYYAAAFDSLDASLPQQNEDRVKIERLYYAQQIKNIVACEGDDRVERHETLDSWKRRMENAGLRQIPLSSYSVSQAKLLLQFCSCEGYRLHEQSGAISLGWQQRQLLTASAWSY